MNCKCHAFPGYTHVFSHLLFIHCRTGYKFQQQVWQINGFGYDSLSADTQVNLTLYVQVCRNFPTPPPGCSDVGAAYIVSVTHLTLCMLGNCACFVHICCFQKNLSENRQSVNRFPSIRLAISGQLSTRS